MSIKGSADKQHTNPISPSNFTSSLMNNPKENYAKSLYIELVLDVCGGKTSVESMEKFKTILDWLLGGMISDEEFDMLFVQWAKQSALTITDLKENLATSPQRRNNLIESEWNKFFMENYSDYQLDVLMGMLISFQNKELKSKWECTDDWLRSVEQLFFLLDDENRSLLTLEEILVLVIVISSDYARNGQSISPEFVLNQAFEVMNDAGAYKGAITLRRFKKYFNANSLDKKAIESSVSLLSESPSVNNLLSNSLLVNFEESLESPFVIPKLWREAVLDTKKLYSNSENYDHFTDEVMEFLLREALLHKQSLKNTSLGFEGALHLFFAFSKKTIMEKQYSTEEIKKEPIFEIFDKTLGKFHSLIKQTVNTYAYKESGGRIDNSTMTYSEDDHPERVKPSSPHKKTPEKNGSSIASTTEIPEQLSLELSPPPIEDMGPITVDKELNTKEDISASEENADMSILTPTKSLHKKELEKIGALNIKLPFDIDRMLRNAEWVDIKPSNILKVCSNTCLLTKYIKKFPYLPKSGKDTYFDSFLRKEVRKSIYTDTTRYSDKLKERIVEERILETEDIISTTQDVRKVTILENKSEAPPKQSNQEEHPRIEDIATPIKPSSVQCNEKLFSDKEIEEEVEKFLTLQSKNESTPAQESEEDTLMFHKLLKKQRAESSKNLNYDMGSPELEKNDLSTLTNKSSPELLSQPKEYEPDILFINDDDSLFISPTIPKKLESAFRSARSVIDFAPQQSQYISTPKVLYQNTTRKKDKKYIPNLSIPPLPKKPEEIESPRQSLNTILTTALKDSSAILKESEASNYSPSKTISVKLTDFIDDKPRKTHSNNTSKSVNATKKTTNSTNHVSTSKGTTQKPRVVEDTLMIDAKRPKTFAERKK